MSTQKKVEIKKIFSERLNGLIGERSVSSFARHCGLKQAAVDRYTKASSLPAADAIVAISETCGVSSDWLLGLTDDRTPGITQTATGGSINANNSFNTPAADTARLEELLETQRRLIATQQRLLDAMSVPVQK